jgi:Tfp pilus assembly protein PilN
MGVTVGLAAIVGGAIWFFLDRQVTQQQANVTYMKQEIDKLDTQIEEIRKIREETASLLAKKAGRRRPAEQPLRARCSSSTSSCASFRKAST